MTFDQLAYFCEVYQQKSITHAANSLFISRQALSLAIRRLEAELEVPLFLRIANTLVPTPTADKIYISAVAILKEQNTIMQNISTYKNSFTTQTNCSVGLEGPLAACYADALYQSLSENHPNIHFTVSNSTMLDTKKNIFDNFDIILQGTIRQQTPNVLNSLAPDYTAKILLTVPNYIWCSTSSPLSQKKNITLSTLEKERPVIYKTAQVNPAYRPMLHTDYNPIIDVREQFIAAVEKDGCYVSDSPLFHGKMFYENILNIDTIICKKTALNVQLLMMYRKTVNENILLNISNFITQQIEHK